MRFERDGSWDMGGRASLHLPGRAHAKLRHHSQECPFFQNRLKYRLNSQK
jgi:hypothetical protein